MAWCRSGTVSVTGGSDLVTGSGTWWLTKAKAGDGLSVNGSRLYEIKSVDSNEALTLGENWDGETAENLEYFTVPVSTAWAVNDELVTAVNSLMTAVNSSLGSLSSVKAANGAVKADSTGMLTGWLDAIPAATAGSAGLMTASDKVKLNAVSAAGDSVVVPESAGVIDCSKGDWFLVTSDGDVTVSLTNPPETGTVKRVTAEVILTAEGTVYWPETVKWADGAPETGLSGITLVNLVTADGGASWLGSWTLHS